MKPRKPRSGAGTVMQKWNSHVAGQWGRSMTVTDQFWALGPTMTEFMFDAGSENWAPNKWMVQMIKLTKIWINRKLRYPAIEPPRAVGLYSCLATSPFREFSTNFFAKSEDSLGFAIWSSPELASFTGSTPEVSFIMYSDRCCREIVKQNHAKLHHGKSLLF